MSDSEYSPLTHQVAGCHGGALSNILLNKTGQILKPYKPNSNPSFDPNLDLSLTYNDLQPICKNERDVYGKISSSDEKDLLELKTIAPKYFGSKMVNDIDHVMLEDLTYGMKFPCVLDLKVGKVRYYPGRSELKAQNDKIKYRCLQEYGFCIAGIKICDPKTGSVETSLTPPEARKLSSIEVANYIKKFMHFGDENGKELAQNLLDGVKKIQKWAQTQKSIILRGSSLLLVYDAAALANDSTEKLRTKVNMIDFAHVFHSFGKIDENYAIGANNLVHLLETGELKKLECQ